MAAGLLDSLNGGMHQPLHLAYEIGGVVDDGVPWVVSIDLLQDMIVGNGLLCSVPASRVSG